MTGALAEAAGSAPVTQWGPRLLLTLLTLAVIGLGVWGMARGWRQRQARQGDIPAPGPAPADLPSEGYVTGQYVATTRAGDLLDRIAVHGLGNRGRAALLATDAGVHLVRTGEDPIWIPRASLREVRLGSGQAQKAYEAGGLVLIGWTLGATDVETGFRADDPDQHIATARAIAALAPTAGGPR